MKTSIQFDPRPGRIFHRFRIKDDELDALVHDQVVGVPALIFHRYHEAGKTKIRENEYGLDAADDVEAVLGYDANLEDLVTWRSGVQFGV